MEEKENYKYQLDKVWEIVTWIVVSFIFLLSYVLFRDEINFSAIVILLVSLLVASTIFYRLLHKEREGTWGYSFGFKNFIIGLINIVLTTLILFFSGGLESPFFFLYFLVMVSGAIALEERYVVFELLLIWGLMFFVAFSLDQFGLVISLPRFLSITIISLISWQTGKIIISQREELLKLNRFKSDFISMSLHQIRNPLTSLRWFLSDIFMPELSLAHPQKQNLNRVYESILGLIFLINNLRDLVRLEIDKFIDIKRIDLIKVTKDAIGGLHTIIEGYGLKFVFKGLEGDVLFVRSDLLFTSDVIKNLILNSVIFNKSGGRIIVRLEKLRGEARFSVKDTGYGIHPKDQPKIFTKFFRTEKAKILRGSGAGLSLYVAKIAIERCGGRIWFESEYGKGTIFYFTLPLA